MDEANASNIIRVLAAHRRLMAASSLAPAMSIPPVWILAASYPAARHIAENGLNLRAGQWRYPYEPAMLSGLDSGVSRYHLTASFWTRREAQAIWDAVQDRCMTEISAAEITELVRRAAVERHPIDGDADDE